ncbi:hypothetical protein EUGRSUZ_E01575 [Eucalyptus grandis]|uniref:Uncharacterized protein n=2 Tax=Eucalyptus grandis TaxID=71139 RepID=A0A059C4K5_EUCGR|nr:hypothetical protein EUGRSUZ_E01575 [Eucalyptus grandis]
MNRTCFCCQTNYVSHFHRNHLYLSSFSPRPSHSQTHQTDRKHQVAKRHVKKGTGPSCSKGPPLLAGPKKRNARERACQVRRKTMLNLYANLKTHWT